MFILPKKQKEAITSEFLVRIILWIIFAGTLFFGINYLLKKFGILG
jgi:hypothetical protein